MEPPSSSSIRKKLNLSKKILQSNLKKLFKSPDKLKLMDDAISEQFKLGIIEKIPNLDEYWLTHPNCSFLPHMVVFNEKRETTKCRVVFLSNLCERNSAEPNAISHNQAILSGPSLNQKLAAALIHLRFDPNLL